MSVSDIHPKTLCVNTEAKNSFDCALVMSVSSVSELPRLALRILQ